jgi:hypothetical protein
MAPLGSLLGRIFEKLGERESADGTRPDTVLGQYRAVLERALRQPLPPELPGPPPRPDVWGTRVLWWTKDGEQPVMHLAKEDTRVPICLVRPEVSEPGAWQLFRPGSAGEELQIRSQPDTSTENSAWRLLSEQSQEFGRVKTRGDRLFVTVRSGPMLLSPDGKGGWTAENDRSLKLFSCEPAPSGEGMILRAAQETQAFQPTFELLVLVLASAGRPWSDKP